MTNRKSKQKQREAIIRIVIAILLLWAVDVGVYFLQEFTSMNDRLRTTFLILGLCADMLITSKIVLVRSRYQELFTKKYTTYFWLKKLDVLFKLFSYKGDSLRKEKVINYASDTGAMLTISLLANGIKILFAIAIAYFRNVPDLTPMGCITFLVYAALFMLLFSRVMFLTVDWISHRLFLIFKVIDKRLMRRYARAQLLFLPISMYVLMTEIFICYICMLVDIFKYYFSMLLWRLRTFLSRGRHFFLF